MTTKILNNHKKQEHRAECSKLQQNTGGKPNVNVLKWTEMKE